MKVLHVIPSLAQRYGGPSTAIIPMVLSLGKQGSSVHLIATDADGANGRLSDNDFPQVSSLSLFRRDFSETWKVSTQMWRWLKYHVRDFDLVHIHALWSFSSTVAARACIDCGIPYILRPAGMLSSYSWQHKGWKKQFYWRALERKTIKNATAFHATSQGEEQDIKRVRTDANIFVIPNGVEDSAFTHPAAKDNNELRKRLADVGDKPVILFLSRLHPKKGIVDRLLPAIAELQTSAHLLIVGDEDGHYPGYKKEVEESIKQLNLAGHVHVMEPARGDARWDYFDMADIFILPSHSENFGIVVAEAMARGCPVITTTEVQSSPLLEEANAGIIVNGEINELAAAIDQLLADTELRLSMASSGKQYALENLRWDMIGKKITSMYSSVLING